MVGLGKVSQQGQITSIYSLFGNEFKLSVEDKIFFAQQMRSSTTHVMSCCRAVVDDVGDHALPEPSVL